MNLIIEWAFNYQKIYKKAVKLGQKFTQQLAHIK